MAKLSIDREFFIPEIEKLLDIGCKMMDLSDEIGRKMAKDAEEVSRAIAALPPEAQLPEAKAAADHLAATAHRPQFLECKAMMQRNLGRIIDEVPRLDQEMAARVNELTQKTEVMILKVQSVRQMVGNDSPLITYDGFKKQLKDSLARCELEELKRFVHFDKDVVEYNWKEIEEALKQESLTEKEKQALVQVLFSIGEKETEESLRDMEKFLEACYVSQVKTEKGSLEEETYVLSEHFEEIVQLYEVAISEGAVSDLQIRYKDIMKVLPKSLISRENKDIDTVMEGPKVVFEVNYLYGIPCLNASIQVKGTEKHGVFSAAYENVVDEKWSWNGVLNPELGKIITITKDGFTYDWNGFSDWMGKENLTYREQEALVALVYSIGEHEENQALDLLENFIGYSFANQVSKVKFTLSPHFQETMNQYKEYVIKNGLGETMHKNYSDVLEACNYLFADINVLSPKLGPCIEWVKLGNNRKFLEVQLPDYLQDGGNGIENKPVLKFFVFTGKESGIANKLPDYMWHIMKEEVESDLISGSSVFEYLAMNAVGAKSALFSFVVGGSDLINGNQKAKQNIEIYELQRLFEQLKLNGTLAGSEDGIFLLDYKLEDITESVEVINKLLEDNGNKMEKYVDLTEKDLIDYIEFYFKGNSISDKSVEELEEIRNKVELACGIS